MLHLLPELAVQESGPNDHFGTWLDPSWFSLMHHHQPCMLHFITTCNETPLNLVYMERSIEVDAWIQWFDGYNIIVSLRIWGHVSECLHMDGLFYKVLHLRVVRSIVTCLRTKRHTCKHKCRKILCRIKGSDTNQN